MKPYTYIIGIIFLILNGSCVKENKNLQVLDHIINSTKANSLYRNNISWDTLTTKMHILADKPKSIEDLSPALNYMFKSLKDEHSQILYNNSILANYYGPIKEHQKVISPSIYNEIQTSKKYTFHAQQLDPQIGYLRIINIRSSDIRIIAEKIQDEVCKLIGQGVEHWIIDLRYNGGGNLMPMAEGIAIIIGDGKIGGGRGLSSSENRIWKVKDGDFYIDDNTMEIENKCAISESPRIAVLVSPYTASSGEALAICFKAKAGVKFFGNKTFGQITGNDFYIINDSITANLSTTYFEDREGIVYYTYVDVDEYVDFIEEPLSDSDTAIALAKTWIKQKTTE